MTQLLSLLPILASGLLLALAYPLPGNMHSALPWIPWLAGGATVLLGLYFRYSRLSLAAGNLLLMLSLYPMDQATALQLAGVAAFQFGLIACYRERGLFTLAGAGRLLLLLLPYLAVTDPIRPELTRQLQILLSNYPQWAFMTFAQGLGAVLTILYLVGAFRSFKHRDPIGLIMLCLGALLTGMTQLSPGQLLDPLLQGGLQLSLLASLLLGLYAMAYIDTLTGIPGRRAMESQLASLGRRYTIAMTDVDHFKKFNDTWGHDIGDQVLRLVASRLNAVGGGGRAFRYGGEEFAIIFPGKSADRVRDHLEDVREAIADYPMKIRANNRPKNTKQGRGQRGKAASTSRTVHVTISIGVAERSKQRKESSAVIKAADQALYKAKKAGRNCVR